MILVPIDQRGLMTLKGVVGYPVAEDLILDCPQVVFYSAALF